MWACTRAHPSHHFDVMRTGSFVLYRPFAAAISLSIKWKTIRSSTFQFISFVQFNKCPFLTMKIHKHTHEEWNSLAYMIEEMIEVGNGGRVLKTPVQPWHWTG